MRGSTEKGGNGGGTSAAFSFLLAALVFVTVGCAESSVAEVSPAASPTPAAPASPGDISLQAQTILAIGKHVVADLNTDGRYLVWATDSSPIANQMVPPIDTVEVMDTQGKSVRVLARAQHGGFVDSPLPITSPWVAYLEYKQHGFTASADFWYLTAVNLGTGQIQPIAAATAGPALDELPRYAAADGRLVWDQLDATGTPILRLHDFNTGVTSTLAIPAGMFPVNPVISHDLVVFVDNSVDPNRANEDWLGRRGALRRYDLLTNHVTTVDSSPTAFMADIGGGQLVWLATSPSAIKTTPLSGGPVSVLGAFSGLPQTNGTLIVWYDARALNVIAYGLESRRFTRVTFAGSAELRGTYALWNTRLYFAPSPDSVSGSESIQYVDLGAIGN